MIRRSVVLLSIVALAVAAALLTPPSPESPPEPTTIPPTPDPLAFARCPWSFTDGLVDSSIVLAASEDRTVVLTSPLEALQREVAIVGPGAAVVQQSSIGPGVSPVVAEFPSVPAAAGVVARSDLQAAGITCPNVSTKVWLLGGGSTVAQTALDLVLFNPFPEDANVELRFVSENGAEPLTELEDVAVPAGSVRVIDIEALLPSRLDLAVAVDDPAGLVTPAFRTGGPSVDWSLVAGTSQSDRWEFPIAGVARHDAQLVLVNDGPIPVTASIDFFTESESLLAAAEVVLEPRRLAVVEIDDEVSGLAVDADGPLGATVVGDSFGARYAVGGLDRSASEWYLTPGASPDQTVVVRLMNTSASALSISVSPVGAAGVAGDPEKISVPPGTIRETEVVGAVAVLLESGGPFTAGWYWTVNATTAASHGIAVTE